MRKKIVALVMVSVLCLATLAGCSKDTTKKDTTDETQVTGDVVATEAPKKDAEKVQIRVTRWGDTEYAADKQLIDEFNSTNDKNIEIVYDVVPGDGYGDRLTTSFSSGDGYDVFLSGEGDFFKWVDKGLTYPMNDLIANDKEYVQPVSDSLMAMGNINGQQSYIVAGQNPICLYYNRDMFDKMGVAYPTDDWTWDDLYAAAAKLTTKNDDGTYATFGFNAQSWAYAVLTYLQSSGLDLISEDGTVADGYLNSPEVAAALESYFAMAEGDNRVSPSSADLSTFGSATAMMISGNLGMFISGGWDVTPLRDAKTNYGTALIPGNHASYVCAAGFAIGKSCKNPEAAWEVVKLLSNQKASLLREELEKQLPTSKESMQSYLETADERDHALIRTLDYGVQPIGLRSMLGSKINEITANIFERIIFKDGTTQTILDEALESISK